MKNAFLETATPVASASCPICGKEGPHTHTGEEILAHRNSLKSAPVSTAAATTASASEPDLLSALKKAARLLKAAGFAMTGTATSQIVAAIDAADSCAVPPPGWQCTRPAGHEGPCAAIQATSNDSSRAADGQQGASRAALEVKPWREAFRDMYPNFPLADINSTDALTWAEKEIADWRAVARAPLPAQGNDVAATSARELTDREIMEEWDRHYLPGKAKDVPFLRTVVEFARHFIEQSATSASAPLPAQAAADAARLDLIDSVIREDGYLYLHNNRAREPLGLLTKPGELRESLDGLMERRAAQSRAQSDATGGSDA